MPAPYKLSEALVAFGHAGAKANVARLDCTVKQLWHSKFQWSICLMRLAFTCASLIPAPWRNKISTRNCIAYVSTPLEFEDWTFNRRLFFCEFLVLKKSAAWVWWRSISTILLHCKINKGVTTRFIMVMLLTQSVLTWECVCMCLCVWHGLAGTHGMRYKIWQFLISQEPVVRSKKGWVG